MSHELPKLVPPLRCALVEEGVYRGAYPSLLNHRYLARLRLRTVVSLLPEPPSSDLVAWCHQHSIHLRAERVATFKDEVTLTHERVAQLLLLAVQPERQPVYVHCSSGVAATGMLIMCLRKLQRWAPAQIYAEYSRFARDRGDVPEAPEPYMLRFLRDFKPDLECYAQLPARMPSWLALSLGWASAAALRAAAKAGPLAEGGDGSDADANADADGDGDDDDNDERGGLPRFAAVERPAAYAPLERSRDSFEEGGGDAWMQGGRRSDRASPSPWSADPREGLERGAGGSGGGGGAAPHSAPPAAPSSNLMQALALEGVSPGMLSGGDGGRGEGGRGDRPSKSPPRAERLHYDDRPGRSPEQLSPERQSPPPVKEKPADADDAAAAKRSSTTPRPRLSPSAIAEEPQDDDEADARRVAAPSPVAR